MIDLKVFNPNKDYEDEGFYCPKCGKFLTFKGCSSLKFAREEGDGFEFAECPKCHTQLQVYRYYTPAYSARVKR